MVFKTLLCSNKHFDRLKKTEKMLYYLRLDFVEAISVESQIVKLFDSLELVASR